MPVSQSSVDGLRRDVDRLNQPLRIVLLGFVVLKELFSNLKAEHKLADFPKQAAPAILAALKETLPAETWCAPQLSGPANQIRSELQQSLTPALGEQGADSLARVIMGTRPPALQLEEHLTSDCIIGLYPQGDEATGSFLMRLKPGLSGLTASHLLCSVAGPALREIQGNNLRVFIDRSIRGLPKGKGKGQGPGRNKGKSKGQKGGRGRLGIRQPAPPANLPPPPAANPPAPPAGGMAEE